MTNLHVHIVSFNVPYPPNYGGVIDVYEKIRALRQQGVQVHLHCFAYGRGSAPELEASCVEVHLYPRSGYRPGLPYIVASRRSAALLRRLDADDYPILFEGIHTTYPLLQRRWPGRILLVRPQNVEAQYYRNLAALERNPFRKAHFRIEARLLRNYEKRIAGLPVTFLCVHPADKAYFGAYTDRVEYLPSFVSFGESYGQSGVGGYVLYHGDLSVIDNALSAEWLLREVHRPEQGPWIIAGKSPSRGLRRAVAAKRGVKLWANPGPSWMEDCIRGAQVLLVHSFNTAGLKIKLLHALRAGRHCVVRRELAEGTGLEPLCVLVGTAGEYRDAIRRLHDVPVTEADLERRRAVLGSYGEGGVSKLLSLLYPESGGGPPQTM